MESVGGDSFFMEVIGKLRKKFEFGAYNEGDFEFCGVKYFQWDDGSIEMGQDSYIQKIQHKGFANCAVASNTLQYIHVQTLLQRLGKFRPW